MISKSGLAILLSKLLVFDNPKVELEQYTTDSEIAASFLHQAFMMKDIEKKKIADLGAGTGILGIGCLELGAKEVIFVEKDKDAIKILKKNLKNYKNYKILNIDVSEFDEKVDITVMNPPFGVKKRKADKMFLDHSKGTIYYMGKLSSEIFLKSYCKDNKLEITHFWKYVMKLKKTMSFHKKRIQDLEIGVWRIIKS